MHVGYFLLMKAFIWHMWPAYYYYTNANSTKENSKQGVFGAVNVTTGELGKECQSDALVESFGLEQLLGIIFLTVPQTLASIECNTESALCLVNEE